MPSHFHMNLSGPRPGCACNNRKLSEQNWDFLLRATLTENRWFARLNRLRQRNGRVSWQAGDELGQFNGDNIPRWVESWLRNKKPGDELHLRVLRREQAVDLTFALGGKSESVLRQLWRIRRRRPGRAPSARVC